MSFNKLKIQNELTTTKKTEGQPNTVVKNSIPFGSASHHSNLTRRAKRRNQPSRHPLMSQFKLKRLSAVYERPIKVEISAPPKKRTKATQDEQQVTRTTPCTKAQLWQHWWKHHKTTRMDMRENKSRYKITGIFRCRSSSYSTSQLDQQVEKI